MRRIYSSFLFSFVLWSWSYPCNGNSNDNSLPSSASKELLSSLSSSFTRSLRRSGNSTTSTAELPIRINCGNIHSDTMVDGIVWRKDAYWLEPSKIEDSRGSAEDSDIELSSIEYKYRRASSAASLFYEIPVPYPGFYVVTLHLTEFFFNSSGQRVFDIQAEGTTYISSLDIFKEAGGAFKPITKSILLEISDGILNLSGLRIEENPIFNGIVIEAFAPTQPTSSPAPTTSPAPTKVLISPQPTKAAIREPTPAPFATQATYQPGNLTKESFGLILSEGLAAKIIAESKKTVKYHDGSKSAETFHSDPDAAGTFPDEDPSNPGGWIYVSNSEAVADDGLGSGGVGALKFDKHGNVINYKRILTGTTANCGGGKTSWGSWITCEEFDDGEVYEVDPAGIKPSRKITMGSVTKGKFESFAADIRNPDEPHFFVTKDSSDGEFTKFTPDNVDWNDPWDMLHGSGKIEYLVLNPEGSDSGTFTWTTDLARGQRNAEKHFQNAEGIDVYQNQLYFIAKEIKKMFILNLDDFTYTSASTEHGQFDGQPDQIIRLTGTTESLLYFTDDGQQPAGVHARNGNGDFVTILLGPDYSDETTGLSFSPDGKFMYVAYQDDGLLFAVWREDGLPFHGTKLDLK